MKEDDPKSIILIYFIEESVYKIFSGFKSQCIMLQCLRYTKP
jgi:hypothetical protein